MDTITRRRSELEFVFFRLIDHVDVDLLVVVNVLGSCSYNVALRRLLDEAQGQSDRGLYGSERSLHEYYLDLIIIH